MPRSRKHKRGGVAVESPKNEDEASSLDAVAQNDSTTNGVIGVHEEDGDGLADANNEELELKLNQCIENTLDKSLKTRQAGLKGLRGVLREQLLYDVLIDRRVTVTVSVEKCLKKGNGEEQVCAATLASLLCIQLEGGQEAVEVYRATRPLLVSILMDKTATAVARQSCATALGICCFVTADDIEEVSATMTVLETLFSPCGCEAGGVSGVLAAGQAQRALQASALLAWTLLLTIYPASGLHALLQRHLSSLPELLSCEDVTVRIAAGETMALLFELSRELDQDFVFEGTDGLFSQLKALATDGNKHRGKCDRRKQRAIFRKVLHSVQDGEVLAETVKFGLECMYVNSWARKRTYEAFKEALGPGVWPHLQGNVLLRDIFELGPPILINAASVQASKLSKFERNNFNTATFKARTKSRAFLRDKRVDCWWND
ncbi:interferon-related developmental regulator 1-like [Lampetra fluviatilis]